MIKITIPVFFDTPETKDRCKLEMPVEDSELAVLDTRIFLPHIIAYFPRKKDGKIAGTTIDTSDGYYQSPLPIKEVDRLIENAIEWEENRIMSIGEIPSINTDALEDQINNILRPGEKSPQ